MARRKDFTFYEADAMMMLANPFVDINVDNVGKAFMNQKPLKVCGFTTGALDTAWVRKLSSILPCL